MNSCKILIADDEYLARQAIKLGLTEHVEMNNVMECSDGISALESIISHLPEIVFLDLQMPGLTGFEVLQSLPQDFDPYLIIVTAHDQYALKAFEYSAADYLVKPFSAERFNQALQKALKNRDNMKLGSGLKNIQALGTRMEQLLQQKKYKARVSIKDGAKILIVPCEDIVHIAATGDYTTVCTAQRKYLHSETLAELETSLDPALFVRVHRSEIVNVTCIRELQSHYNGDYTIVLHNGDTLKLSRNYREQLLQRLG